MSGRSSVPALTETLGRTLGKEAPLLAAALGTGIVSLADFQIRTTTYLEALLVALQTYPDLAVPDRLVRRLTPAQLWGASANTSVAAYLIAAARESWVRADSQALAFHAERVLRAAKGKE